MFANTFTYNFKLGDKFILNQRTTVGVDYKARVINIGGEDVKLQIWETAGQERFRSMTAAFYNKAQGVIITFDVTQKESFQALPMWIEDVKKVQLLRNQLLIFIVNAANSINIYSYFLFNTYGVTYEFTNTECASSNNHLSLR